MAIATPSSSPAVRRKRRWFQFSLRTLLVVVLLAGCGMGWLSMKAETGRRQKAAVEAIVESGGVVTYDYEQDSSGNWVRNAAPPGPKWLQSLLGVDCFQSVHTVFCNQHGPMAAADFRCLKDLKGLKILFADGQRGIPAVAFNYFGDLSELQALRLDDPALSDSEIGFVRGLAHLKVLGIRNSRVTDAGLQFLRGLTQLEEVDLTGTQIGDAGLDQLSGLGKLKRLDFSDTRVTDRGLRCLSGLNQLDTLNLDGTEVKGPGLVYLKGLRQLRTLYLRGSAISDDAIPYLAGLTQLSQLWLGDKISDAGGGTAPAGVTRLHRQSDFRRPHFGGRSWYSGTWAIRSRGRSALAAAFDGTLMVRRLDGGCAGSVCVPQA